MIGSAIVAAVGFIWLGIAIVVGHTLENTGQPIGDTQTHLLIGLILVIAAAISTIGKD